MIRIELQIKVPIKLVNETIQLYSDEHMHDTLIVVPTSPAENNNSKESDCDLRSSDIYLAPNANMIEPPA